jgi:hypothetical protein
VRRSGGFDVPDFLAAGPRDVLVPQGGESAAREVLGTRATGPAVARERTPAPPWVRAVAVALAALVVAVVVVGLVAAVLG